MKTPIAVVLSSVFLAGTGIVSAGENPGLKDAKEKISYSVGYEFVDDSSGDRPRPGPRIEGDPGRRQRGGTADDRRRNAPGPSGVAQEGGGR